MSNDLENALIKLFEWCGASGTAISIVLQFLSDNSQTLVGISASLSIISYFIAFIGKYFKRKKNGLNNNKKHRV